MKNQGNILSLVPVGEQHGKILTKTGKRIYMKLFSGSSSRELTEKVCRLLKTVPGAVQTLSFPEGTPSSGTASL